MQGEHLCPIDSAPHSSRACSTCQSIDAASTSSATLRCGRVTDTPVARTNRQSTSPSSGQFTGTGLPTSQVTTRCLLTAQCMHRAASVPSQQLLAIRNGHTRRCTNGLRCGTNSGPASLMPLLRMSTSCPAWRNMKRIASTCDANTHWLQRMCHAVCLRLPDYALKRRHCVRRRDGCTQADRQARL